MFTPRFAQVLVVAAASLQLACASETSSGSPPVLTDLTITQTSMEVGKQITIDGIASVEDSDGDIASLQGEVTLPDGRSQALASQKLQGASGVTKAPIRVLMAIVPPSAGEYTLTFWVRDEAGNDSGRMSRKIPAK